MEDNPLRFIQILAMPWQGSTGIQSSIIGLATDGKVYKFYVSDQMWHLLPPVVAPQPHTTYL